MNEDLKKGDIILAPLSYSDLVNDKLWPALVLYHDPNVTQLTVAYISSKIPAKPGPYDIVVPLGTPMCIKACLAYDSEIIFAEDIRLFAKPLKNHRLSD
jgi:hypothetical protein